VKPRRRITLAAVLAVTAAIGFSFGRMAKTSAAEASETRSYTLRIGDTMTVPAVGQLCAVYTEGGMPELFCARPRHPRHQVTMFRDSILIWKVGKTALHGRASLSSDSKDFAFLALPLLTIYTPICALGTLAAGNSRGVGARCASVEEKSPWRATRGRGWAWSALIAALCIWLILAATWGASPSEAS
jgi:hypothetical protein